MNLIDKILGPASKYDASLPYTYEACIDTLDGLGETEDVGIGYFYSETLCGIIEYLIKENVTPDQVKIFAVFDEKEIELDLEPVLTKEREWLSRPKLCRSLEKYYQKTLKPEFKGHHREDDCSYDDRERTVI